MKLYFTFLAGFLISFLGSCAGKDSDFVPDSVSPVQETENLSFRMELPPASTRGETVLPAEQINSLRMILVDSGYDSEGEKLGSPSVEYNKLVTLTSLKEEFNYSAGDKVMELSIPKIHAGRNKKLYILINAEPSMQSYLGLRLEDGSPIEGLGEESLFLPDENGVSPFDHAIFKAPIGSYVNNDIQGSDELLTPVTAMHTFTVPTLQEIEEKFPTVNSILTYYLPGELMVVRAVNKIWFEFTNATYQEDHDFDPLDLLVTSWALSDVNEGDSYLLGQPGDNEDLFSKFVSDPFTNINAPWMQWLYKEAKKSENPSSVPEWLTEYSLPASYKNTKLVFYPGNFTGSELRLPEDNEGIMLPAPVNTVGTMKTTELLPVYFSESKSETDPQTYTLEFTVWQREKGGDWGNPFVYSITSSDDMKETTGFRQFSLFRNTDVVMNVKFKTGKTGIEAEVDVHPYGNVVLDPDFGL